MEMNRDMERLALLLNENGRDTCHTVMRIQKSPRHTDGIAMAIVLRLLLNTGLTCADDAWAARARLGCVDNCG
ncbi:MAG: hypothetical protein FWF83_06390, partial [Clostridiales bacterium]|nr:hypothetical protein [Clostridiales bacterium]